MLYRTDILFMKKTICIILLSITIISCAKKGTPSGGEKDITPPVMVSAFPENYSTNVSTTEISIRFNEYIKLKDLTKQLIISPPLKIKPSITPVGSASKKLTIKIYDTLQENTTYAFNFGKSIVDNNEGNAYPYFKYVFSTGHTIDSLQLTGSVKDALLKTTENFVSVLLYEAGSTFTDSIIYTKPPRYITNTLDSTTNFTFENLKPGKYFLAALKEEVENYKYNPKTDKIAFKKEPIIIPSTQTPELTLFKERQAYRALKPKHERENRIKFRYEGDYANEVNIQLLTKNVPKEFKSILTKEAKTDSLQFWFTPKPAIDSLLFTMQYQMQIDTFAVRLREKVKKDSLSFKSAWKNKQFKSAYAIQPETPIVAINESKITIINKDSVAVPFTITQNKFTKEIQLHFTKQESQQYIITAYPSAFIDLFNKSNDTLTLKASTKAFSSYGNIRISLKNKPETALIIQLISPKGDVEYEQYSSTKSVIDFTNVLPGSYDVRIVYDTNANKQYDTGRYLIKQQPEKVWYHPDTIEIRANWDWEQEITLE